MPTLMDRILRDSNGLAALDFFTGGANQSAIFIPGGLDFITLLPEEKDAYTVWTDDSSDLICRALPPLMLTAEVSTELEQIMAEINNYATEMNIKFLTGSVPVTYFDEFVKTLRAMNIDRAIQIFQEAYDLFNAK